MNPNVPTLLGSLAALLISQSAVSPRLVVPDAPDVTIKTRRTTSRPGAIVTTEVVYLKDARQRREEIVEYPPPNDPPNWHGNLTWPRISQCDERRTLLLNPDAKTYVYEPIADPAAYAARLRATDAADDANVANGAGAAGTEAPSREMTTGPVVTITIDTVDTGERRRFGHYVARHVIMTKTVEPGPGASTPASVDTHDGWYIDVPPANCVEWEGVTVSASLFAIGPSGSSRDQVQFKHRGTARRGYPIEETIRMGDPRYPGVIKTELVEISEAPLDDALFTVPAGYRAALPHPYGGYDLSRPDTIMNRVESYRQVAADWANYFIARIRRPVR